MVKVQQRRANAAPECGHCLLSNNAVLGVFCATWRREKDRGYVRVMLARDSVPSPT